MVYKVLFVFHEDSQSGAPKALLAFLKFIKDKYPNEFQVDIYIMNSFGELEKQLKEVSNKIYITQTKQKKIAKIFKRKTLDIHDLISANKYHLIYGNTIVSLDLLNGVKLKFPNLKSLLHVHESEFLCSQFLNKERAINQFKNVDSILTVSNLSANNLIENYEVEADKVFTIPPSIIQEEYLEDPLLKKTYKDIEWLLITIGHPNLTKGTDLLPQIANVLRKRNPKLNFKIVLVGFRYDNDYFKAIKLDVKKLGLEDYIEFVPHVNKPLSYLYISNTYLIPSREDSFSLMSLEAVKAEKPVVVFKNAVGSSDFFAENGFYEANYLDIEDFVGQIESIYFNPILVAKKTASAKKIFDENLNYEIINEKHFQFVKNILCN